LFYSRYWMGWRRHGLYLSTAMADADWSVKSGHRCRRRTTVLYIFASTGRRSTLCTPYRIAACHMSVAFTSKNDSPRIESASRLARLTRSGSPLPSSGPIWSNSANRD
ncbi:hypothetical protein PBRA_001205, partial [Plasmodiophora brassicae]